MQSQLLLLIIFFGQTEIFQDLSVSKFLILNAERNLSYLLQEGHQRAIMGTMTVEVRFQAICYVHKGELRNSNLFCGFCYEHSQIIFLGNLSRQKEIFKVSF